MEYAITIADGEVWGITAARNAHNAGRPATIPNPEDPTGPEIPNPTIIATDAEYMQFVMVRAVDSWLVHYPEANPQGSPVCT